MSTHAVLVIDPFLLCLPSQTKDSGIEKFLDRLLNWQDVFEQLYIESILPEECCNELFQDPCAPSYDNLLRTFKRTGCDFTDPQTVHHLIQRTLRQRGSIESFTGIHEILNDPESSQITPPYILNRLGNGISEAFAEALYSMTVARSFQILADREFFIASGEFEHDSMVERQRIDCQVNLIEIEVNPEFSQPDLKCPVRCSSGFEVYQDFSEVRRRIGVLRLWQNNEHHQGIEQEIANLIKSGVERRSLKPFFFGNSFFSSLESNGFNHRSDWTSVLIETCARIVMDIPKDEIKFFRESEAPTAPQLIRDDGAKAFRTHLTKKGAGFRLMYWVHPDGKIEFANVGRKSELKID